MKITLKLIALLAATATVFSCQKPEAGSEEEQGQPKEETFVLSLSNRNINVSGLSEDCDIIVDNSARTAEIVVAYADKAALKALDVTFSDLAEGVTAEYTNPYDYSAAGQTVKFVKGTQTIEYTFSASNLPADPHFVSLAVNGIDASSGIVKVAGSTNLAEMEFTFTAAPEGTEVYVGANKIASGDTVDFSDKINGVTFTLKCDGAEATQNVKIQTTGISSITRVWGHYVAPVNVSDNWFGTKVDGTKDALRNVAINDEYIFLTKDKVKSNDVVDRTGIYAISLLDPDNCTLLSREGFTDDDRFFACTTLDGTLLACSFTMGDGGDFRIFKYDSVTSDPVQIVSYNLPENMRFGDKITAEGDWTNGRIWVYDNISAQKMFYFTVTDNRVSATPTEVYLDTKMGNYGCFYKYAENQYVWGGNAVSTLFSLDQTTATAEFSFPTTSFSRPMHGIQFFTINDESYMGYVVLANEYQDGQFRITPLSGETFQASIETPANPYAYFLGDPEAKEAITAVKNGNGLGSGAFRTVGGKNYFVAFVPGAGISLFEIK